MSDSGTPHEYGSRLCLGAFFFFRRKVEYVAAQVNVEIFPFHAGCGKGHRIAIAGHFDVHSGKTGKAVYKTIVVKPLTPRLNEILKDRRHGRRAGKCFGRRYLLVL